MCRHHLLLRVLQLRVLALVRSYPYGEDWFSADRCDVCGQHMELTYNGRIFIGRPLSVKQFYRRMIKLEPLPLRHRKRV